VRKLMRAGIPGAHERAASRRRAKSGWRGLRPRRDPQDRVKPAQAPSDNPRDIGALLRAARAFAGIAEGAVNDRIGELLVQKNLLSEEDLRRAKEEAKATGTRVGLQVTRLGM